MRITAVINIRAGGAAKVSGKKLRKRIQSLWADLGHQADIILADGPQISQAIQQACANPSVEAIIIGGGDGTISRALPHIVAAKKSLGILPLGTMNYMARNLGLSFDPIQAAKSLVQGQSMMMDLGAVNGRLFMIWTSVGSLPEFIRGRDDARKKNNGLFDIVLSGVVQALVSYPMIKMEIRTPTESWQTQTSFLMISNNICEDGNPLFLTRAHLNKGELGLYLGTDSSLTGLAEMGLKAALGQWGGNSHLQAKAASWIEVRTAEDKLTLMVDGEILETRTPLVFESIPSALQVLLPGN